jgi:hypothetical protein
MTLKIPSCDNLSFTHNQDVEEHDNYGCYAQIEKQNQIWKKLLVQFLLNPEKLE